MKMKENYFSPKANFMLVSTKDIMSGSNESSTPPDNVDENQGEWRN